MIEIANAKLTGIAIETIRAIAKGNGFVLGKTLAPVETTARGVVPGTATGTATTVATARTVVIEAAANTSRLPQAAVGTSGKEPRIRSSMVATTGIIKKARVEPHRRAARKFKDSGIRRILLHQEQLVLPASGGVLPLVPALPRSHKRWMAPLPIRSFVTLRRWRLHRRRRLPRRRTRTQLHVTGPGRAARAT